MKQSMKILVQIVVDPPKLEEVCKKLAEMPETKTVYEITGEFDIFVELDVNSIDEFREVLKNKILKIEGVKLTESSVVLGEWK